MRKKTSVTQILFVLLHKYNTCVCVCMGVKVKYTTEQNKYNTEFQKYICYRNMM